MSVPVAELVDALGQPSVLEDPDRIESYRRDQTTIFAPGQPCCVVLARDSSAVATTLAWATRHRVPVVPRGGGTSLAGGATAVDGCVVLCLGRMTAIRELDPANQIAVVEAGVITADLDRAAREHGLMYAPDPSSYEMSTIGGNLATNAGGLRCVKYGVTRDAVLGLEAVLASGKTLSAGRRTMKGVAGYDLTGLLVGSEGTLAVITAATLRLRPRPVEPPTMVVATFAHLDQAAQAVSGIVAAKLSPSLLELIDAVTLRAIEEWKHLDLGGGSDALLLAELDGSSAKSDAEALATLARGAGADLVAISIDEAEAAQFIAVRRLAYPAIERLGSCLVEDVCVPRSALAEMMRRVAGASAHHKVMIATVAHAGDGNLHPIFVFDRGSDGVPTPVWAAADEVFRAALALGGTLTGEHGIGTIKRRWLGLELSEESLGLQAGIKAVFDPLGILNPGKVF